MKKDEKEKIINDVFGMLASYIHKDYSAGPDGFKIYKNDVGKLMAKVKKEYLKPRVKLPDDFPKF